MSSDQKRNPVLADAYRVMDDAQHVSIDNEALGQLAEGLVGEYDFGLASWDAPVYPSLESHSIETVIDFIVVGNSLNYCFNDMETGEKFTVSYQGTEWSGAYGMWAGLHRALTNDVPILDDVYLKDVTETDIQNVFEPVNGASLPMIESRVEQLNSVGELMSACGGTFREKFSGESDIYGDDGVVEWLANTPAFEDTATYNGRSVRFDKRAQLTVSMLYGKLLGTDCAFDIRDMDAFTIFPDYGIPAGLASHGALVYTDELEQQIADQIPIVKGSAEEVEIRAATMTSSPA